jgi:hypothetical protein
MGKLNWNKYQTAERRAAEHIAQYRTADFDGRHGAPARRPIGGHPERRLLVAGGGLRTLSA